MTVDTQKIVDLIGAFDDAAQDWGWAVDQGYGADVPVSEATYKESKARLMSATFSLLDEIDRLRAELQARQWISVDERMPEPSVWVLVHNQRWTGIGNWIAGDHLNDSERWQDEHAEFIEQLGPKVTHWMPLPPAPPQGEKDDH